MLLLLILPFLRICYESFGPIIEKIGEKSELSNIRRGVARLKLKIRRGGGGMVGWIVPLPLDKEI